MANKRYDAIFVGNGLISLSAAATLAKNGQSVLLLDLLSADDQTPPGFSFDFATGPLLYLGFERWGAMEGFFSQLACSIPSLKERGFSFQKAAPMVQLVLPRHRINLHADAELYFDELKREFNAQAQKLKTLFDQTARDAAYYYPYLGQFQQLEIKGLKERVDAWKKQLDFSQAIHQQQKKKALDLIAPYSFPADLHEYFKLLVLFAFKKSISEVSAFEMTHLLSSLQRGGVSMLGGYPTLVRFFHQLIRGWGGEIIETETISKQAVHRKQVTALTLSDGSSFEGSCFVVARPSEKKSLDFNFTIPEKLIPSPMQDVLLMTWDGHCPEILEDLIVIRLNQQAEVSETENLRLLSVSLLLRQGSLVPENIQDILLKKVLDRLYALIPFSQSEITLIPSPVISEKPGEGENGIFTSDGVSGKRREVIKGVFSYFQPKGQKNVYFVDSEEADYLGWGVPFLAGHRLAQLIES